jgi:ribosomal protein S18 acetylase RimI-like enzyme
MCRSRAGRISSSARGSGGTVAGLPDDGLELVPLRETTIAALGGFVAAHGVSRFLVEPPYAGEPRERYLAERVVRDAAGDDAIAWAALRNGSLAGLAVLRLPAWDREHFGFPAARVEHLQGADAAAVRSLVERCLAECRTRGAVTCSARVSGDALMVVRGLEEHGFRFQEVVLSPWRDLATWRRRSFGVTRLTEAADVPALREIARRAFRTDRFHRDTRFPASAADAVYSRWVDTWHADRSSGRFSRVLLVDGSVAGFFLYEVSAGLPDAVRPVATLVLDAVDPDVAGRGLGYMMYCDVLDAVCSQASYASSTVAVANPAALGLYIRLGFRLTGSGEVTLHWWSDSRREE